MLDFIDAAVPDGVFEAPDSAPPLANVEYPCKGCGKEAGPYSGRGRKPVHCKECKPRRSTASGTPKVSGSAANLAAQATAVLVQLNGMIALGVAAVGMFGTGRAIADANSMFEQQAYAALSTDPEFCKMILKSGAKSAKLSLALAYGGLGMAVGPVAIQELKEKKAARQARQAEDETGA